jgi:hypothetical protein
VPYVASFSGLLASSFIIALWCSLTFIFISCYCEYSTK